MNINTYTHMNVHYNHTYAHIHANTPMYTLIHKYNLHTHINTHQTLTHYSVIRTHLLTTKLPTHYHIPCNNKHTLSAKENKEKEREDSRQWAKAEVGDRLR